MPTTDAPDTPTPPDAPTPESPPESAPEPPPESRSESSSATPREYRIELEAYAGPMDLLLYLVRRHEVDLTDLPVAALTDQYLAYLEQMKQRGPDDAPHGPYRDGLDVDQVGEFLVMAAYLLELKSQMLMPLVNERLREQQIADGEIDPNEVTDDDDAGDPDEPTLDPRQELMRQLLAYKAYKDASIELERRGQTWRNRAPGHAVAPKPDKPGDGSGQADDDSDADPENNAAALAELDLDDASVTDLFDAFARVMDSIGQRRDHEVTYDETPISVHVQRIRERMHAWIGSPTDLDDTADAADAPQAADGGSAAARPRGVTLGQLFRAEIAGTTAASSREPSGEPSADGADGNAEEAIDDPVAAPTPKSRSEMVGVFLALLELIRQFELTFEVDDAALRGGCPPGDHLVLRLRSESERQRLVEASQRVDATDWTDPDTGEVRYDWPDEEGRRRAERRARLRAKREAGEASDEADLDGETDEVDEAELEDAQSAEDAEDDDLDHAVGA